MLRLEIKIQTNYGVSFNFENPFHINLDSGATTAIAKKAHIGATSKLNNIYNVGNIHPNDVWMQAQVPCLITKTVTLLNKILLMD